MLTTKITSELADWISQWIEMRNELPTIESCYKFVEWKACINELKEIDKIQIEAILLYESQK